MVMMYLPEVALVGEDGSFYCKAGPTNRFWVGKGGPLQWSLSVGW